MRAVNLTPWYRWVGAANQSAFLSMTDIMVNWRFSDLDR